jgi:hypothetical protein
MNDYPSTSSGRTVFTGKLEQQFCPGTYVSFDKIFITSMEPIANETCALHIIDIPTPSDILQQLDHEGLTADSVS